MSPRPRSPDALRRSPGFLMRISPVDLAEAQKDAAARKMSLAAHVRALLRQWRKEHRR